LTSPVFGAKTLLKKRHHGKHLITGGAGFIGSHLSELLLNRDEQVSIIDCLSTGRFSNIAVLEKSDRFQRFIDDVQ
jgi:UDP-glucose 4-epimerase